MAFSSLFFTLSTFYDKIVSDKGGAFVPTDFLGSFGNVLSDKAGAFGIFATPYAPIILLALIVVIIISIMAALKSRGNGNLIRVLEEAKDREVDKSDRSHVVL